MSNKTAVILTCFNRAEMTVTALTTLLEAWPKSADLRVFCVDDGSTDGTADRIAEIRDDRIEVIVGNGELFWACGMRLAESFAMQWDFDWLLWINDDIELLPGVFDSAFMYAPLFEGGQILVGGIQDQWDPARTIYGGRILQPGGIARCALLPVDGTWRRVDTFNGNFVLIDRRAHDRVGRISGDYRHSLADYDYGLRASTLGVDVRVMPQHVAIGSMNPRKNRSFSDELSLRERVRLVRSPIGLPPAENFHFHRRYATNFSFFEFARQYFRVLLPRRTSRVTI